MPLRIQGGSVLAGELPILTGLSENVFMPEGHRDQGQLVLGLQQQDAVGAVSSFDVTLGEVSSGRGPWHILKLYFVALHTEASSSGM